MVDFQQYIPQVSTAGLLNGVMIVILIILALGVIGFFIWYLSYQKKYSEYDIEILDKDSNGNVYRRFDRGGVFFDKKSGYKLLWLQKAKTGLTPDDIPYISTMLKNGKVRKTVTLRKTGTNNYVFVRMQVGEHTDLSVSAEDINNAAAEMSKNRRIYNKESFLKQIAPWLLFIGTMLVIMIVLISLFNKFEVMREFSENMAGISHEQKQIMELLLNVTTQPTITPITIR